LPGATVPVKHTIGTSYGQIGTFCSPMKSIAVESVDTIPSTVQTRDTGR
jgi:hypothetical protein